MKLFSWLPTISWGQRSLESVQPLTPEAIKEDIGLLSTKVYVSAKTVLGYAPVYQAVSKISGDVAKLPLSVYQKTDAGRSTVNSHPVHKLVKRNTMTNPELNSFKFMRRFMTSALLWGNAYAFIDRNRAGEVLGLYPLLPDRTYMERRRGRLWAITEVGGQLEPILAENVLHIEGISINGLEGESIIKAFRQDFESALHAKNFVSKFFSQGMTAGGILQAPPSAKPEVIRKMQKAVESHFSGSDNAFKTIVLRDGFRWFSTQVDPQKAQLTEVTEEGARNVARIFNLSPSQLGLKDSTSYNSEEMAKQDYYDSALSQWLVAISSEFTTKLLTQEERDNGLYLEHNVNALLWADAKSRSEIAIAGIMAGRFSPDETREWENMDKRPGGSEFYRPLNMGTSSDQQPANTDAARGLLVDVLSRTASRLSIKLERGKSIADEQDAVAKMVDATIRAVESLTGNRFTEDLFGLWLVRLSMLKTKEEIESHNSWLIERICGK